MEKEKKIDFSCIDSLEQNPPESFMKVSFILLKLIHNVLLFPADPKFRKIRLENTTIKKFILPAIGAMECLFAMGFQEGDDCLILPDNAPLQHLKTFQSEIQRRRNKASQPKPKPNEIWNRQSASRTPATARSSSSLASSSSSFNDRKLECEIFLSINSFSQIVKQYENRELQEEARSLVPICEILRDVEKKMRSVQSSSMKIQNEELNESSLYQILFLEALMLWFKNEFFKWMNNPACSFCNSANTVFLSRSNNPQETNQFDGTRTEVYVCQMCANRVLFPRYNDVSKLLKTRSGRCGEWANCFTFLCKAFGYDARLICDWTDHVWTEVYIHPEQRWVHFDCCEGVLDSPLLYEIGWKKSLSYVLAFSRDEVQDVTWRYTSNFASTLERRTACSEEELALKIANVTNSLRSTLSPVRSKYLRKRQVRELTDFLSPPKVKEGEKMGGRLSGSLAWRMSRGETSESHQSICYSWTPTKEEIESKVMTITYDCARDEYSRACGNGNFSNCLSGWQNGLYSYDRIFRKEEKDWKKVYLSRTEDAEIGTLKWVFDVESSGLEIDSMNVVICSQTFSENAAIHLRIYGKDKVDILSTPSTESLETTISGLENQTVITLDMELRGGEGDIAWQQAQLFRQSLDANSKSESMPPFSVTIRMKDKQKYC